MGDVIDLAARRAKMSAMPDGSFPIRNYEELRRAINALPRAEELSGYTREAFAAHIEKRRRELVLREDD